jgi:hypothetical protein
MKLKLVANNIMGCQNSKALKLTKYEKNINQRMKPSTTIEQKRDSAATFYLFTFIFTGNQSNRGQ